MVINVTSSDIKVTQDNMVIIAGLPAFRIDGGCFEFTDRDKLRCKARGGNKVRVRVADLVGVIRGKQ